ncbi:Protein involved in Snf1 protein kinase complex assembly [Ceraceosorus bombacis]|uniref:Protein involved in Snf1 protein kinase complex assembly n=1 Tax=Ceraceosorus bombacis TaxID=401625 RepID=A0A0N7L9C4_9BASI|nr:Protein involved in Snf1 protein kinase complex assembly [Ceraceosorus bombacis]
MGNTPSSEREGPPGAANPQQGDRLRRYNGLPAYPSQPSDLPGGGRGATTAQGSDDRSPSPTLRRASTTGTQPVSRSPRTSRTSASLRQAAERAAQLSPTRVRARSGSSGGVLAAARKPSSSTTTASQAPAFRRKKSIELIDADDTPSSGMTPLRRGPGTLVPPPFEPNLVVSPYPSPSVATVARHASGMPSHFSPSPTLAPTYAGQSLQSSSAAFGGAVAGVDQNGYVSAPQPITGIAAFAPAHRSIFHEPHLASGPDTGLSLGTVASTPAGQSPGDALRHGTGNTDPLGRAASKVSSPEPGRSPLPDSPSQSLSRPLPADEVEAAVQATHVASEGGVTTAGLYIETNDARESVVTGEGPLSADTATDASRAATPTPGQPSALRSLTTQTRSEVPQSEEGSLNLSPEPSRDSGERRRSGVQVFAGVESGVNTPAFPGPAPHGRGVVKGFDASQTSTPASRTPTAPASGRTASAAAGRYQPPSGPLRPVTVTWRGGGREVFVTGTFANEWRSKVPLKRPNHAHGGGRAKTGDHIIVLHLEPGTHRLKFIVDDRWRVSRDLPTATDGSGNLVNYIEMPILDDPDRKPEDAGVVGVSKQQRNALAPAGMGGHATAHDLQAAKRQAEVKRGDLDEVFGPDKAQEEIWTQDIPSTITRAQQIEEAYRDACEAAGSRGREPPPAPLLPLPPLLPRQLSTVLLNASPANPAVAQATGGTVDDLSLLPAPPNSAILHHLTASAIKNGCVAVGTTIRFKKKVP